MSKSKYRILWIDDEIETLKTHVMFLESKGYDVTPVTNAYDAMDLLKKNHFDIIFLDERMPGKSGMEFLDDLNTLFPSLPVVMITQSEEENLMNQAIGSRIADFFIKPINLSQVLAILKKHIEKQQLIQEKVNVNFPREYAELQRQLYLIRDVDDWKNFYHRLTLSEINLDDASQLDFHDVLWTLKEDANRTFARQFMDEYLDLLKDSSVLMSHNLLLKKFFPLINTTEKLLLLVIDNLRYDQWVGLKSHVQAMFEVKEEDTYFSILPTATQYARNALFSGLMPLMIKQKYPLYWIEDEEETSRNRYEPELFEQYMKRHGITAPHKFIKILNIQGTHYLEDRMNELLNYALLVVVYNFVDTLSHAKTNVDIVKELAKDEKAYRSITTSWFKNSVLYTFLQVAAQKGFTVFLTTDHGSVRVKHPVKIFADKETNVNIRFKYGKNLKCDDRKVFRIHDPEKYYLPKPGVSTSYMFCTSYDYFVYPTNQGEYERYFMDTFQHGGISLEENIIPFAVLIPK
jgi:DNA-binding response OmpR family regulator